MHTWWRRSGLPLAAALTVLTLAFASAASASAATGSAPAESVVAVPDAVHAALLTAEDDANAAVAVLDTTTGAYYGSAQADTQFPTESVVKVLIAAKLLATGQLTGNTEQLAYQMITQSDDDAADDLWGVADGPSLIAWAESRYGITDLGAAPIESGQWGNTKITASGLVRLYAAIKADPVVGPWLMNAMDHMEDTASDGTDQAFGLAAQTSDGGFKQGWGGDDDAFNSEQLNSTGFLEDGRYAVAILVQHIPYESMDQLLPVINALAAAVAPGGVVTVPASAATSAPASSAPAVSASPSTPATHAPHRVLADGTQPRQNLAGRQSQSESWFSADSRTVTAAILLGAALCLLAALALRQRRHTARRDTA
ncbi:MAG: putative secreted protein [Frankiales bacterium]|nr:putative secreted protein [Frankiales bacterium]